MRKSSPPWILSPVTDKYPSNQSATINMHSHATKAHINTAECCLVSLMHQHFPKSIRTHSLHIQLENVFDICWRRQYIYYNYVEEHITHVDEILKALNEAIVANQMSKCSFFSDTIDYLGHIIRSGKLDVSQININTLKSQKMPTNKSKHRSFLCICNTLRRFIAQLIDTSSSVSHFPRKTHPTHPGWKKTT